MALTERETFVVATMRRLMGADDLSAQFRAGIQTAVNLIEGEAMLEVAQEEEALRWHGILDREVPA